MVKNYTSLPLPADGLVSRWGSSTSSYWRSSQLFWLSLYKHTDRYGVERCRICFFIMYQLVFFCNMQRDWRDVFRQEAGCAWTTSSFLFCSSWHQQSSIRAVLFVIFLDFFCCTEDLDRKIQIFFFQWGNTPPHQCCVFHSSFRFLLLFLAPGAAFCTCYQAFAPWPVLESRWQEEVLPVQHSRGVWGCVWSLPCSTLAWWRVHTPESHFLHL